jgi:uncharacterized protein (DUF3820 family)
VKTLKWMTDESLQEMANVHMIFGKVN